MNAGPEIDALIAEKVMGFIWAEAIGNKIGFRPGQRFLVESDSHVFGAQYARRCSVDLPLDFAWSMYVPYYSTRISEAWRVVDKLLTYSCDFELERAGNQWHCVAVGGGGVGHGATPMLAICHAALDLVEVTP